MARDLMSYFRAEARELLQNLSQDTLSFESHPSGELLSALLRHAHTLKGAARVVEQAEIADAIHKFEGILDPHRAKPDSFPASGINELLACLDEIGRCLARLEERPVEAEAPTVVARAAKRPDDGGIGLLTYQGVEVDSLLDDLRAASGQVEVLRRNLHNVERGKTLGELLLVQLSGEGIPKGARFVAEELQAQLRGVERTLAFGVDQIERDLRQVRESTEKLRLVPAEALFPILRRVLRDAASEGAMRPELETSGGGLRLDASLLAGVQGALIQAIRNSVAHGIETPEQRLAVAKPAQGKIRLEVLRQGRKIIFRCRDDGRGVDLPAVRRGMERKGVSTEGMDGQTVLALLMRGGISTAETVSQTAGRGIGLDLIRDTMVGLGGEATLDTEPGLFTELTLSLPWTVAGLEFLELSQGEETSVLLPLDCVRAALRLSAADISREASGETIVYGEQGIPLLALGAVLGTSEKSSAVAVVIESSQGLMALAASSLRGTRTASLLPLPPWARAGEAVAGAVLDADGDAMLVLDPDGLYREALRDRPSVGMPRRGVAARLLVVDDSLTTRMLQQSILESAGFQVDLASSAEQGLEMASQTAYGLILVDVEMPGMDGFSFLEQIRSDPALRDIPAIMVTSRDAPEDRLRGQSSGAQGYMVKSEFDQKELLRQIRGLLP